MNKPIELPARTAGECTLADGTVVWVQTLNALQYGQAHDASQKHSLKELRAYRKGSDDLIALRQDFRALSAGEQATYLAGHEYEMGRLQTAAQEKHPDPQEPERNDLSDEAFVTVYGEWEDACNAAAKARKAHEETLYEQKKTESLALTARRRLDLCVEASIAHKFAEVYVAQHKLETLRRAVRREDDHSVFHFRNTQEIEDLADVDRESLLDAYRAFDSVTRAQVPTSAA